MNYLAHCYLADPHPDSLIGNLMGDFAKGPVDAALAPAIRQGILLHRRVDAFTDSHAVVKRSKRRIEPPFRRYGGILVDLFYDHFLACDWRRYSPLSLPNFSRSVYFTLAARYADLPARMRRSVAYMIAHDLLSSYREIAGVRRALQGVGGRLQRPIHLGDAVRCLQENYQALAADFAQFFPDLIEFTALQKQALAAPG